MAAKQGGKSVTPGAASSGKGGGNPVPPPHASPGAGGAVRFYFCISRRGMNGIQFARCRNKSEFYIVRHGLTAWNREMRMQGHTDVPLDVEGAGRRSGLLRGWRLRVPAAMRFIPVTWPAPVKPPKPSPARSD